MNLPPTLHEELKQAVAVAHETLSVDFINDLLAKYEPAPEKWRTEHAVMMTRNEVIWNTYPSQEAADAFVADFPDVPMHVVTRRVSQYRKTLWVKP